MITFDSLYHKESKNTITLLQKSIDNEQILSDAKVKKWIKSAGDSDYNPNILVIPREQFEAVFLIWD